MLKVIGCLIILGASTGIGFTYAEKFRKRTTQLNEIQRCIHQLENEIVYTHTPLPEAIRDVAKKSINPIQQIFKEVADLLFSNEVDNVYEAFSNVLVNQKENLNLKREDVNIILDLAKSLGESDINGQLRMFSLTLENLKKKIKDSESLMNKNVKMYRYLGFSLGAMLVVILI